MIDTTKRMGEILAQLGDLPPSGKSCPGDKSIEDKRKILQDELDALSTLKSAYIKCFRPDLILPDLGT